MARPDLAMRMGIASPHHGAAVFEDLHIIDDRRLPHLLELLDPGVHYATQSRYFHARHGEIVARRETNHPADARFRFGDQQSLLLITVHRCGWLQGGEIIVEDEG